MAAPRRPDPPPLRTNEYLPVIVITVGWAIASIVLATQHQAMSARGQGWWLWVAVSGFALGLWGLVLVWLYRRGLRKAAARAGEPTAASGEAGEKPSEQLGESTSDKPTG